MNGYKIVCEATKYLSAKEVIKELATTIPLIKQFINRFDKKFLKSINMNVSYWNPKWEDLEDWYIVQYNWQKLSLDNENEWPILNKFINGIEDVIIKTLTRKGWKLKGKRNDDAWLQKEVQYGVEVVPLYGGDNDGNIIGPNNLRDADLD